MNHCNLPQKEKKKNIVHSQNTVHFNTVDHYQNIHFHATDDPQKLDHQANDKLQEPEPIVEGKGPATTLPSKNKSHVKTMISQFTFTAKNNTNMDTPTYTNVESSFNSMPIHKKKITKTNLQENKYPVLVNCQPLLLPKQALPIPTNHIPTIQELAVLISQKHSRPQTPK